MCIPILIVFLICINYHYLFCFSFIKPGWKSRDSVPKLVDQYLEGKLMVDEFVTHKFGLNEINEAFNLMHAGQS